jgi:GT2 family glycosyltransferase
VATSVLIPTHGRAPYLDVALRSVRAQGPDAEVVVVVHGPDPESEAVARARGARVVALPAGGGINVARNAAVRAATGDLLAFLDDDVEVRPGWLAALEAAHAQAGAEVGAFAGRIEARVEDHRWRQCGREGGPVTELRAPGPYGWGANLALRRDWLDRVGPFEEALVNAGDEQEWQDRLRAAGGEVRWVGEAAVDHRRAGDDARLRALMRAAYHRGRAARRFGAWEGRAPRLREELAVLAGCLVHGPRFACMMGPVMAAHSWGRVRETRSPRPFDDFLSGRSGTVGGRRDLLREAADRVLDRLVPPVPAGTARDVLVLCVARPGSRWPAARAELERSRHRLDVRVAGVGGRGKFENLNALLPADLAPYDWVLVVDDDVDLPAGFLDRFLAAAEAEGLVLAQPAHRRRSHAAWPVTRRRARSVARRTTFVEIGPVTAFAREAAAALLPFPPLRMGWGLDAHWSAVARDRGWPIGVVDATPVAHVQAKVGASYDPRAAIEEARAFLRDRPYVRRDEVGDAGRGAARGTRR